MSLILSVYVPFWLALTNTASFTTRPLPLARSTALIVHGTAQAEDDDLNDDEDGDDEEREQKKARKRVCIVLPLHCFIPVALHCTPLAVS